jgi:hypothetical protein
MTTVTIVTGEDRSGRRLVGAALAAYLRSARDKHAYAVTPGSKVKPDNFSNKLDDLILVSSGNQLEEWMQVWIEQYGAPLFTIHIKRHDNEPSDTA